MMSSPMLQAVHLAEQAKGDTAPNPCVGAVLTKDDAIEASGWHRGPGCPHAEVEAIAHARKQGLDLTQLTLWVTLEPCNHYGRTPPCTQAILEAGIPRVIIGTLDPNPQVSGGGADRLRRQGVEVRIGEKELECLDLILDFKAWTLEQRPFVQLKLASTLDGRIATRSGHSAWVTGEQARQRVHGMRARAQAVLVGSGTLYADDPYLTQRVEQGGKQPWAVVAGSRLPAADSPLHVLRERAQALVFWTSLDQAESDQALALRNMGVRVWGLPQGAGGALDLAQGLHRLFQELQVYTLVCEGGGRLGMSLIQAGGVDELHMVFAPKVLGDTLGISVLSGREVQCMDDALPLRLVSQEPVGPDLWLVYRRP